MLAAHQDLIGRELLFEGHVLRFQAAPAPLESLHFRLINQFHALLPVADQQLQPLQRRIAGWRLEPYLGKPAVEFSGGGHEGEDVLQRGQVRLHHRFQGHLQVEHAETARPLPPLAVQQEQAPRIAGDGAIGSQHQAPRRAELAARFEGGVRRQLEMLLHGEGALGRFLQGLEFGVGQGHLQIQTIQRLGAPVGGLERAGKTLALRQRFGGSFQAKFQGKDLKKRAVKKKKSPPKKTKITNPDIKIAIDHFHDEYLRRYSFKPDISGAHGRIFEGQLKKRPILELKKLITLYLDDLDNFLVEKAHPIELFLNRINALKMHLNKNNQFQNEIEEEIKSQKAKEEARIDLPLLNGSPDIWLGCLDHLEMHIFPESFEKYIRPIKYLGMDGNVLYLEVPGQYYRDQIAKHFNELIRGSNPAIKTIAILLPDEYHHVEPVKEE